ncbi:MAG TPA: thermonuclease family protein [Paludibacter sp.]
MKINHTVSSCFLVCTTILLFTLVGCGQKASTGSNKGAIEGEVVKIVDGDTYDLRTGDQTIRVKMEGIDAPEKGMRFYKESKKYLHDLCLGRKVLFKPNEISKFNKQIGFTYLSGGLELSHEMVRAGYAWHFKKYNSDNNLYKLELQARIAKRGIWADPNPVSPQIVRKLRKVPGVNSHTLS